MPCLEEPVNDWLLSIIIFFTWCSMSEVSSETLDPQEVDKFRVLAETWWDTDGPMRPLHQINPLRLEFMTDEIYDTFQRNTLNSSPLDKIKIVDVGCAGGLVSEPLAHLGAHVTGLDPTPENIHVAKLHAEKSGLIIDYKNETLEQALTKNARYDVVIALEVIEHVADVSTFVESCCTAVNSGGLLFMSTLNRTLRSFALAKIGAEYILRWLPVGTHDWQRFIRPEELEKHLKKNGFRIKKIEGIVFSPLSCSWHRSRDISVNYQICATRTD